MSINIIYQRYNALINIIFFAVLILGIVVSVVVYLKGASIAEKTVTLIAEDVPTYDSLRKLNNTLIEHERYLYELYATEEKLEFRKQHAQIIDEVNNTLETLLLKFDETPRLQLAALNLADLNIRADEFIKNIVDPQTDFSLARQQLRSITDIRRAISPQIQQLIQLIENQIDDSQKEILLSLKLVRFFVVLYGLIILITAFLVARALKAYLSSNANNQRLSLFSTRNPNPIISLDNSNKVTYANLASETLLKRLGFAEGEIQRLIAEDIHVYQTKILSDNAIRSVEFEYQITDLHFQCEMHWLEDQRQWDLHLTDVTDRKNIEKKLLYRATHNPESGLNNSYELEKRVVKLCSNNQNFAFGLIEIRSFSQLISGQGYIMASRVVKELATSIEHIIYTLDKTGCSVFHVGDKSFAIISTNDVSRGQIYALVKKIEEKIASLIFHSEYQVRLDFGFVCFPEHGDDYTKLHRNALAALDKSASSDDKEHMFFAPELGEKIRYEQALVEDIRIAIELQQFELYFQPQLALTTGNIMGAEVLIRWQRDGQWISPGEFIPLAERAGLIESLGDWILLTACEKAKHFIDLGLYNLVIAVNISPIQFAHKDFLSKVRKVLKYTGLPAKSLELEITEGVIIYNEQQTIDTLEQLKKLGVQLAIDDFGTGYSSLSYLKKFNIDKLKIDQSFIRHIYSESADHSIVRTIVELGRNLDLKLIAEGVEDLQQQKMLEALGCDEIQGYYFSQPLPEQEFIEFVQQHRQTQKTMNFVR